MINKIATFAALITLSFSSYALNIEGIKFDDRISLNETNQILTLNGAGFRHKYFLKIYAAGLYLENKSHDVDTILNHLGSKLLVMHIVYKKIERKQMIASTLESFQNNLTEDEFKALKSRIDSFLKQYQSLSRGDILIYDYIPGKGTRFTINNTFKGVTLGSNFNTALLKIWLGKRPASEDLKKDLLSIK